MKYLVSMLSVLSLLLASCATQAPVIKGDWRKSPETWLNGAEIYSNVESLHGAGIVEEHKLVYRAGTHNFDGPLRWQFVLVGQESDHVSVKFEEVQISTEGTRRSITLPEEMLGGEIAFAYEQLPEQKKERRMPWKKKKEEVEEVPLPQPRWIAQHTIPTILQLYPKADGKVVVVAKIQVTTKAGAQSEWVNFALLPHADREKSFVFRVPMIEYGGVPID